MVLPWPCWQSSSPRSQRHFSNQHLLLSKLTKRVNSSWYHGVYYHRWIIFDNEYVLFLKRSTSGDFIRFGVNVNMTHKRDEMEWFDRRSSLINCKYMCVYYSLLVGECSSSSTTEVFWGLLKSATYHHHITVPPSSLLLHAIIITAPDPRHHHQLLQVRCLLAYTTTSSTLVQGVPSSK